MYLKILINKIKIIPTVLIINNPTHIRRQKICKGIGYAMCRWHYEWYKSIEAIGTGLGYHTKSVNIIKNSTKIDL